MSEIENTVQPLASLTHRSRIRVLGKHSLATPTQSHQYPEILLSDATMGVYCPELETKPQQYTPSAKRIFVEGNLIAIIDCLDNLWFISELFPMHINLSLMLYKKVKNVFLGENQCLISNRKSPIILNWGAKKILDVSTYQQIKLSERNSKNMNGYFTAHQTSFHRDDKFLYSLSKKVDNSNKLYHVRVQNSNEIDEKNKNNKSGRNKFKQNSNQLNSENKQSYSVIAYPLHEVHNMKHKISGVSVGKFHCMCWDVAGMLYTWGNRSIALGYDELPHQKITTTPQPVRKLNKFVTSAFAATHYSLALTSDGHIYEWGIKKESNLINQELIFQPKVLKIDENRSKIILMKGRNDQFACLNSRHQLFIWGERTAKFLSSEVQKKMNFKNGFIFSPFLVPHFEKQSIVDFGIGEDFIAVLIPHSKQIVMSQEEKVYWDDMIRKIKRKLKIGASVKTQAAQVSKENESLSTHKLRNSETEASTFGQLQFFQANPFQSTVEKSYHQRQLKKKYFKSLKNQDKLYSSLFKPSRQSLLTLMNQNLIHNQLKQNVKQNTLSHQDKKTVFKISLSETKRKFEKQLQSSLTDFKLKFNSNLQGDKNKQSINLKKAGISTFFQSKQNKFQQTLNFQQAIQQSRLSQLKKTKMQAYSERLQKVQHKKKSLQESFSQQVTQRVRQNSIEFRMDKHEKIILAKIHEKNKNLLRHTVQAFLIKHYLIRLLAAPVEVAREIKICQFGRNLHLSRIQKNLRSIFIKARVKHGLKKLRRYNFATYALLCTIFKHYVKKRRQNKAMRMRKIVAQQLYKNVLREKIRFGLSKSHLNTRKLQKFRQWLLMTKIERMKCLKILWKNHLLSIMKVTNDQDSITISKSQQNCTFEALYKQRVAVNPMLKLETFLNKTPIFQLRFEYFQSIIFLFRKENKTKSQKLLKGIKCASRRKQKIKFSGESGDLGATISSGIQNSTDIMPYSMHYNLLIRPKSMQINIPENMKKSERWIQQEVTIFEKCLKQIIQTHQINFLKARRKYDIDLAYFIRQKYDSLAQKRWKCIVEYNQIKVTPQKKKKQKQLYRIFDLIGMQKVLVEDCLPEKYLMLEEAVKKRDAPTIPNPNINLGINQFKQIFKKYYESISLRAKQIRKNFV